MFHAHTCFELQSVCEIIFSTSSSSTSLHFQVRDDKRLARWIAAKESRWFKPKITEHELVLPLEPEHDEAAARALLFEDYNSDNHSSDGVSTDSTMLSDIDTHLGAGLRIGMGLSITREGGVINVDAKSAAANAGQILADYCNLSFLKSFCDFIVET